MNALLVLMVLVVYALHQDFWNWNNSDLVFGVLPVGLAYHAGFSVLASVTMWVLVRFAWPEQLEQTVPAEGVAQPQESHG
jgi:hypothetical protein